MLTNICLQIIASMARTLHVTAYADGVENKTIKGCKAGAGQDWMDVAPKTRPIATQTAFYLAGQIATMNGKSLLFLVRDAMKADGKIKSLSDDVDTYDSKYLSDFGHYIVMESLGHGVGWTDDHEEFGLKLPLVEFSY